MAVARANALVFAGTVLLLTRGFSKGICPGSFWLQDSLCSSRRRQDKKDIALGRYVHFMSVHMPSETNDWADTQEQFSGNQFRVVYYRVRVFMESESDRHDRAPSNPFASLTWDANGSEGSHSQRGLDETLL